MKPLLPFRFMLSYVVNVVLRLIIGKTNEKKNKGLMVWTINMNKKTIKVERKSKKFGFHEKALSKKTETE